VLNVELYQRVVAVMGVVLALLCCGCAQVPAAPLPTYAMVSGEESLKIIAARQARIRSVSARCEITLTDSQGQEVKLDGALLAMPLEATGARVRLRAWKLGQAVFDLTLVDGGAWIVGPDSVRPDNVRPDNVRPSGQSEEGGGRGANAAQPARRIAEALDFLGARFFHNARVVSSSPELIIAEGSGERLDRTICEIDRATLTARSFVARGSDQRAATSSEFWLSDYRLVGTIPWAHEFRLRSRGGSVYLTMSDVELNEALPAGAFTPPARAKQLP